MADPDQSTGQWDKRSDEAYDYATYDRTANRSLGKPDKDTVNNTKNQLEHDSNKPGMMPTSKAHHKSTRCGDA